MASNLTSSANPGFRQLGTAARSGLVQLGSHVQVAGLAPAESKPGICKKLKSAEREGGGEKIAAGQVRPLVVREELQGAISHPLLQSRQPSSTQWHLRKLRLEAST